MLGDYVAAEKIVVSKLLGAGGERDVYLHPFLDDRVIKISRDNPIDRNKVDHTYLSALGEFPLIPKMYGWVETQHGPGLMFERIRDANGHTSINLGRALREGCISPAQARSLMKVTLQELGWKGIVLHDDENVDNFLLQRKASSPQLILVDGFGPFVMTTKARLRMRFPWLAREKALRCSYNLLSELDKQIQALRASAMIPAGA